MSKKNNHNTLYILIIFGLFFSPFGFGTSPNYLPSENPDKVEHIIKYLTYFVAVANHDTEVYLGFSPAKITDFFLTPLYKLSTTEITFTNPFAVQEAEAMQKAYATNHTNVTYPVITRHATAEINQTDKHHFTGRFGLPEWILEPVTQEYLPFRSWEDQNIIQFESMQNSFVYDKNACAMTHFKQGYIYPNSTGLIKSDTWVVKFAENGTDIWIDAPANDLECVVTVTKNVTANEFKLVSVKSDVNGTFTVRYEKPHDQHLESFISYNNTDINRNTTKIAFSNILSGSP